MYSPYFDHILGYWEARHNPNILFVTYEELNQNPQKIIRKIAEFLSVSVSLKKDQWDTLKPWIMNLICSIT